MNIHDSTIEYLNKILNKHQQMQNDLKNIQSMRYRKIGLYQIETTDEYRKEMCKRTMKTYNAECSKIYGILNQERQNKGFSELLNPFTKGI